MTDSSKRPSFIVSTEEAPERTHIYPGSEEKMAPVRSIGVAAGLQRIGIHVQSVPPGRRSSYPHAEQDEEEFVYVIRGELDAWIDGALHRVRAGDFIAFPAGTGIAHTMINNGVNDALLLVGGEKAKPNSRIIYPLNPERKAESGSDEWWWSDAPVRVLGPHDGVPRASSIGEAQPVDSSFRPSFIICTTDVPEQSFAYPGSDEYMSPGRVIGATAGLQRIGIHLERVTSGHRLSYPHAEEDEEEFIYVISGELDAWIDGTLHRVRAGDFIAFPAGTGIAHTMINNGTEDALLLVGGEKSKPHNRIFYPLNIERKDTMKPERWWDDVPKRELGPHDGLPDARRGK